VIPTSLAVLAVVVASLASWLLGAAWGWLRCAREQARHRDQARIDDERWQEAYARGWEDALWELGERLEPLDPTQRVIRIEHGHDGGHP
jgi:hypothetical protein